jgi:DNA modification methylase
MTTWRLLCGDVREKLAELPAQSVQCVCTSPPYWGLRDYGTGLWDGGDPSCQHRGRPKPRQDTSGATKRFADTRGTQPGKCAYAVPVREQCRCGARRIDLQIGLEQTPEAYVTTMVAVFREVRRVLREDGVLFLNLGDCYATGAGKVGDHPGGGDQGERWAGPMTQPNRMPLPGLKPKDLCGIPWRVAFALQADGWWLRSDIIWSKPNPMPESVTDRPAKAHEYIFLLSKAERYFYDAAAIAEDAAYAGEQLGIVRGQKRRAWAMGVEPSGNERPGADVDIAATRNKRSVWTVPTQPYPEAHFATFPEDLITPCVLAGSRIGDTVLDPFAGSGTTGVVSVRHQRHFIGIDLNPSYVEMARRRIGAVAPLLAQEQPA